MAIKETITIITPDDWHVHFRDGDKLTRTVSDCAARYHRAIAMPNLTPPITQLQQLADYHQRLLAATPGSASSVSFEPLMTYYLHTDLKLADIKEAKDKHNLKAIKLYPQGVTTNSQQGVRDIFTFQSHFELMSELEIPLLIHGEKADPECDIFDRESRFIDETLTQLIKSFPNLKIVLEHITTKHAVDFILATKHNLAATITPQHLLYNRNQLLSGGIKPHYYCLPILKREEDRLALAKAATSGDARFFLGSDSAPHAKCDKESACGCAGIYSSCNNLEIYCDIFDKHNALDQFEKFASLNGPAFYNLPVNTGHITLSKQDWSIPTDIAFGTKTVVPLCAGLTCPWQITGRNSE